LPSLSCKYSNPQPLAPELPGFVKVRRVRGFVAIDGDRSSVGIEFSVLEQNSITTDERITINRHDPLPF